MADKVRAGKLASQSGAKNPSETSKINGPDYSNPSNYTPFSKGSNSKKSSQTVG